MMSPRLNFASIPRAASIGLGLALTLQLFCLASSAVAAVPNFKGSSADGKVVFFDSEDQLIPGDTDTKRDVYLRSFDEEVGDYVTREVSLGPSGGTDAYPAQFAASDIHGARVFVSTEERLVPDDTDRQFDIYMRDLDEGTTTLVSTGAAGCLPKCGNQTAPATFADIDALGTVVLFSTAEQLTDGDEDEAVDLYVRNIVGGQTELVSGGGNGAAEVTSRGISADGSHVFFTTGERLSPDDTDGAQDIYARDVEAALTSLVSHGNCTPACGNSGTVPIFNGATDDGERLFFSTQEDLNGADDDGATDIYARDLPGGPTILISGGDEEVTASFAAASANGAHVLFTSAEGLSGGDGDESNDIYEWNGGTLQLVTTAACSGSCGVTFDAVSTDSSAILFTSAARLDGDDTDARADIYRQAVGGSPELISRGDDSCPSCWNGNADAIFNDASADASRVTFTTPEGLLEEDEDGENDIYVRDVDAGTASLITTSPSYCPQKKGSCGATFVGSSEDGQRVFFLTVERFTLEDGNNDADIYERFLGTGPGTEVTRLVSTGNSPDLELGPEAPDLLETDPESPASSITPRVIGEAMPGSTVKLYTTANCSGEPVATGTAAQLFDPGLLVTVEPGSLTTYRAAAEAEGFVSMCSAPITYVQIPDAGGGGEEKPGGESESPPGPDPKGSGGAPLPLGPVLVMPRTRITFAPASKTRSRSPTFRFTDSTGQSGTRFECKVDRKPWKGCASPLRLKRLRAGRHVVEVKGVNAVGVAEPVTAKRAFKVVPP